MALQATFEPYTLKFRFAAGTSKGVLKEKRTYFLKLWNQETPEVVGTGEAGPLVGLSLDDHPQFEDWLAELCEGLQTQEMPYTLGAMQAIMDLVPVNRPAIKFALETALLDLLQGGRKIIYDSAFTNGTQPIPINGLIWMGEPSFMSKQIDEKIAAGYHCIKMKIGAIDFDQECEMLKYIRTTYSKELILRVDANGAFSAEHALSKLNKLATFNLHSIEQPIAIGQPETLKELCASSPVPIALDEELIDISLYGSKKALLQQIKPQFIILKPTLLGGLDSTTEWIALANAMNIGWWITSALESNIGLNAIAQYTAAMEYSGHQGLGTGQLYSNNIEAPLHIDQGQLFYKI